MAEDLTPAQGAVEPTERAPAAPPERPAVEPLRPPPSQPPPALFPGRFRVAYAVLAVILGLAAGGAVVLLGGDRFGSASSNRAWSAWEPSDDGDDIAEIASHVAARYRLPSGGQLVAVTGGPVVAGNQQVSYFALQDSAGEVDVTTTEDSVAYIMCGVPAGENCSIQEGAPTPERGRLLHREAYELALYTFKYADAKNVVAYVPPRPGVRPTFALFFRKDDEAVKEALSRPLAETLPPAKRLTPEDLGPVQSSFIDRVVDEKHLFTYQFQQAPDGSIVLVLRPPAA